MATTTAKPYNTTTTDKALVESRATAAAARLRKIGDETDKRKFPHLIREWEDCCAVTSNEEQQAIAADDEQDTLYNRLARIAATYITNSWPILETIYVPRTDSFLNNNS